MNPGRAANVAHGGMLNNESKQAMFSVLLFSVEWCLSGDDLPVLNTTSIPLLCCTFHNVSCFCWCPQIEK